MSKCLFCNESFLQSSMITENPCWFAVRDGFPLTNGHTLIIPKRHIQSIFSISIKEIIFLVLIIKKVKKILDLKYKPASYNLGLNDGEAAGQTIPHAHIHLIPRYDGDGGLPCGIRNIFPKDKAYYLNE